MKMKTIKTFYNNYKARRLFDPYPTSEAKFRTNLNTILIVILSLIIYFK